MQLCKLNSASSARCCLSRELFALPPDHFSRSDCAGERAGGQTAGAGAFVSSKQVAPLARAACLPATRAAAAADEKNGIEFAFSRGQFAFRSLASARGGSSAGRRRKVLISRRRRPLDSGDRRRGSNNTRRRTNERANERADGRTDEERKSPRRPPRGHSSVRFHHNNHGRFGRSASYRFRRKATAELH